MKGFRDRLKSRESGQSTVVIVLALTVILGAAALVVDLGGQYHAKYVMQNAADLAAEAAAMSLPDRTGAMAAGTAMAVKNGAEEGEVTVTTPYRGDASLVEVFCRRKVTYSFAAALCFTDGYADGRAVARYVPPSWDGAALPFLNVDTYTIGTQLTVWDKNHPGKFERISKLGYKWVPASGVIPGHFEVDYSQGIIVQNGKDASIKKHLEEIYVPGQKIYVFSLTPEAAEAGVYGDYGNNELISRDTGNLVLLEAVWDSYNAQSKLMTITVTGIYDIYGNNGEPEFPEDDLFNPEGAGGKLVE